MAAGSADQPVPDGALQERYGILALARLSKDDGRSLILYSAVEDAADARERSDSAPAQGGGPA